MLIGVDVGGTNLRVGVVDGHDILWERRYPADYSGLCGRLPHAQVLQAILDLVQLEDTEGDDGGNRMTAAPKPSIVVARKLKFFMVGWYLSVCGL